MKHLRWLALLAIWLGLPSWSYAQLIPLSSATPATLSAEKETSTAGAVIIRRGLICDGASVCNTIDLTPSGGSPGLPDRAVFAIETATGCASTVDFTPRGCNRSGCSVNYDLSATIAGTGAGLGGTQVVVTPIVNRYITGLIADNASCTDVEIMVTLYYESDNVR